ncbi:hypothetical protein CCACVL1_15237 [Corchorus capsularis]|uniref:Uncharacterized protein n=1 Tax=Corchorus capsularis TaxID=210143 RepID=A0A1R3I355_COCAP|nr:hypothetical protein CCACVL1_15237 [Corchorus capsularis]
MGIELCRIILDSKCPTVQLA